MAKPQNDQSSFNEHLVDYLLEEVIQQPDSSFNCLISSLAAAEASIPFSAVVPIRGSANTSSSQPVPCCDSNSNRNDVTDITNITTIENMGLVDGCTIVVAAILIGS